MMDGIDVFNRKSWTEWRLTGCTDERVKVLSNTTKIYSHS